jgi:AcrR family transcriptional regulator
MSRARSRPTRWETRARLFEAAAGLFEARGVGGASIEAIAEKAGFTRGAFYSNFDDKDELIIAMLEDHLEQSARRNLELLAEQRKPAAFLAALAAADRSQQDPLGRSPLLHIELVLYAARAKENRPELAERLRSRHDVVAQIVEETSRAAGRSDLDPSWIASMLLALEDGFRLHRLIDPETTPESSFVQAVADLQVAFGLSD